MGLGSWGRWIPPPSSHTILPNAYAAGSDAARKDAAQPHARGRIPRFALSVATTTLTKAHNSAPKRLADLLEGQAPVVTPTGTPHALRTSVGACGNARSCVSCQFLDRHRHGGVFRLRKWTIEGRLQ